MSTGLQITAMRSFAIPSERDRSSATPFGHGRDRIRPGIGAAHDERQEPREQPVIVGRARREIEPLRYQDRQVEPGQPACHQADDIGPVQETEKRFGPARSQEAHERPQAQGDGSRPQARRPNVVAEVVQIGPEGARGHHLGPQAPPRELVGEHDDDSLGAPDRQRRDEQRDIGRGRVLGRLADRQRDRGIGVLRGNGLQALGQASGMRRRAGPGFNRHCGGPGR